MKRRIDKSKKSTFMNDFLRAMDRLRGYVSHLARRDTWSSQVDVYSFKFAWQDWEAMSREVAQSFKSSYKKDTLGRSRGMDTLFISQSHNKQMGRNSQTLSWENRQCDQESLEFRHEKAHTRVPRETLKNKIIISIKRVFQFINEGRPSVFEEYTDVERKAFEIIFMNRQYVCETEDEEEEEERHPRRNRMHIKYLVYKKQKEKENIQFQQTPNKHISNDYYYTPTAFNKLRKLTSTILSKQSLSKQSGQFYEVENEEEVKRDLFE
ncbi:hypothetical protein pb186bvf_016819 [Paramecium bursaria]